jgi:RNA polymerase sigma-70 factor (ECF subfamily)
MERQVDPLARLLDGAIAGDPAQVRELLRALSPEVARVARAILGATSPTLDDAVQDSLLRIVHALPGFRRDCSARRFANRIAARTALLARRRGRATVDRETQAAANADARHVATPHDHSVLQRQRLLLDRLLDELPQAQAEALALRFVLGYSLEEAATTLQAPMNTVRSRIRLAKEALRERIATDPTLADLFRGDT